jgi:hypothetical protein
MNTPAEDFLRTAPALVDAGLRWRHRFATLGPDFYARLAPEPLPHPYWVARSDRLAAELGLDAHWMAGDDALAVFAGNAPLAGRAPQAVERELELAELQARDTHQVQRVGIFGRDRQRLAIRRCRRFDIALSMRVQARGKTALQRFPGWGHGDYIIY